MSKQSFRELGVSAPVVAALAARSIHEPFRDPGARPSRRARRARRPRPLAHRVGQDARVRGADRRAHEPRDARPSALVLVPTRELAAQVTAELEPLAGREGPLGRGSVRRRSAACAGQARRAGSRPRRDARPARGSRPAPADRSLAGARPRARRGRPHARHGLPAAGRQDRPPAAAEPPDDVLLGDARRRGRRAGARLHQQPVPLRRGAARRSQPGEIDHHFVAVTADTKVETLVEHIRSSEGLTLVFVRTKRGADRLVQQLWRHGRRRRRHARRHVAERARAGTRAVRERQGRDARRNGRRRARPRPGRRHPRDQLRPAGRGQGLRPPHRPHRPGGPERHRRSRSSCPSSRRRPAASPIGSATATASRRPACAPRRAKLLYTSRRGRRSKW